MGAEPMRTIAFVSQGGGSGKSTIASSLAVAAHEMSERVSVIDMDPQNSLTNWGKIRGLGEIDVIALRSGGSAGLARLSRAQGRDACDPRHPGRGRRRVFGRHASCPSQYRPFAPEHVRPAGQRPNAGDARGDRRRVRVPAQSMPARPANRLRSGRRRDASRNGRVDLSAHSRASGPPGSCASRPGRDGAEPARRGGGGNSRPLAVRQASPGAGQSRVSGPSGGVGARPASRARRLGVKRASGAPDQPPSWVRIVSPPRRMVRSQNGARS